MLLADIASLIKAARQSADIEALRAGFLASYAELESADVQEFSLSKVVHVAFEGLNASESTVALYRRAALNVSRRVDNGEDGTEENPYHNSLHFAKVVINFRALAAIHNYMVDQRIIKGQTKISDRDVAMGLFAATAHDICHDGKSNTVDGIHIPFRLEQISIDRAVIWADAKGGKEIRLVGNALPLIYGTDVSGNPSPASIVRAWHDYYFKAAPRPAEVSHMSSVMRPVIGGFGKTFVASLLQDADILASVMSELQHDKESQRVGREAGMTPSPSGGLFFLQDLLHGRMTTDVARAFCDLFIADRAARYRAELRM